MNARAATQVLSTTDDVVAFLHGVTHDADRGLLPTAYGVFARAYSRMTLELIARIADGRFEDPAWVGRFIVAFAEAYRRALVRPERRCGPWRIAFDRITEDRSSVLLPLLLGINAHMAYDLAMVVADVLGDDVRPRERDYFALDGVLAFAIDPITKALGARYGRWIPLAERLSLGLEEALFLQWFYATRARAWRDALALRQGLYTRAALERRTTNQARLLCAAMPI